MANTTCHYRAAEIQKLSPETRQVTFSFSSETPVERFYGREVLSHAEGSVNLRHLTQGNLLWNHNTDKVLGKVEKAWIEGNRGYATVKWSKRAEALEYWQDVEDGILSNISVGYSHDEVEQRSDELLVKRWTPYEVSLLPIPADASVGIGRSLLDKEPQMAVVEENANLDEIRASERQRITSINALCNRHGLGQDFAESLINSDKSLDVCRAAILDKMGAEDYAPISNPVDPLGLSKREEKEYSIVRAVKACVDRDWSQAGFERECSNEIAKRSGRDTAGFFVPVRDLTVRATYNVSNAPQGGNLVETRLDAANFIDVLRNRMVCMQLGARMLSGLVGNLDIPRQVDATPVYWVSEGQDITQGEFNFDLVPLRPKVLGALSAMTRLMMQQSTPDIENLVRDDLAQVIALEIDRVCINGSGTGGQPRGIMQYPGVPSFGLGTDGAALNWGHVVRMETEVATANADIGSLAYLTNSRVRGQLKVTEKAANTAQFIWMDGEPGMGMVNGYRAAASQQVPRNLSKGSSNNILSAAIFGNWADLLVGEWGILEILPNQFGSLYKSGGVEIRALQTVDVQLRRPQSFCVVSDILAA